MSLENNEPKASAIGRRDLVGVGVASAVSSGVGFVVLVVGARSLTPAENATFIAFWSFLFVWFGILGGLSSETTRATHSSDRSAPVQGAPRMLSVGLLVGVALSVLLAASAFLWGPLVLGPGYGLLTIPLCIAVALFSGHATLVGVLGGRIQWATFARLVSVDSLLRLAFVVAASLLVATTLGFAVAVCISPITWLLALLVSPNLRRAANARADSTLPTFLRRIGHATLASGSSAVLVVGFPILLRLTSSDTVYLAAAPLLLAISLTRAPLLIPLNAYQGVAIAHFLGNRAEGLKALWPIVRLGLGVGLAGGVLAWLIGPWLMIVINGPAYRVDGWVLAGLTFAATGLAILTLTGALCLALDRHRAFSGGWLSATVLAVLVLLLPLEIEWRAILSLLIGPLLGIAIHLVAVRRAARPPEGDPVV